MTVATFNQPAFASQSGTVYKTSLDNSISVLARLAASFAPHEQASPNMTVLVDKGALWVNGAVVEHIAQSSAAMSAPDSGNTRIDRVVIDAATGAASVITGTQSAGTPVAPVIPSGKLPVCQVLLAHSTTAISNSLITDERIMGSSSGGQAFAIGGVYLNITGVNPAAELLYGTWVEIAAGKMLVGYDPADSDFNAAEKTGGGKSKNLQHSHGVTATGYLNGEYTNQWGFEGRIGDPYNNPPGATTNNSNVTASGSTDAQLGATQDVLNPYFVVHVWKRTA